MEEIIKQEIDTYYEYFKKEFFLLSGMRLDFYKENQMKRRINTYIERKKIIGYEDFILFLKSNEKELESFKDYITINVTSFFRVYDQWKVFECEVLEPLLKSKKETVKIWSCACSTGEEAYSLAMSVLNINPNANFEIIASDIDDTVINKAKLGFYKKDFVGDLPSEYKSFFMSSNDIYVVKDEVKKHVFFKKIDLLSDEYPQNVDVIVCRNVLIYFTENGKSFLYKKFRNSLAKNGYLFTGNTEQIIYYKAFKFLKLNNFIYIKGDI